MGFHVCEYCETDGQRPETSSGDVTLNFANGRSYVMPDMISHYVKDHGFKPPQEFIDDVLNCEFTGGCRRQTRGISEPMSVGYLNGAFEQGAVPEQFLEKLVELMQEAAANGGRMQTKGLDAITQVYRKPREDGQQ